MTLSSFLVAMQIGLLSRLSELDLHTNKLVGSIPSALCSTIYTMRSVDVDCGEVKQALVLAEQMKEGAWPLKKSTTSLCIFYDCKLQGPLPRYCTDR
jgi:hypothetical protein